MGFPLQSLKSLAFVAAAVGTPMVGATAHAQDAQAAPVVTAPTTPPVFDQNGKYIGTHYAYDFNRRIDYFFNGRLSELSRWDAAGKTFVIYDQYKSDTETLYANIGRLYDRIDGKDGGKKLSTTEHNQIVAQIQQLNAQYERQRIELNQMTDYVSEKSGEKFKNMPEFRAWYETNKPVLLESNPISRTCNDQTWSLTNQTGTPVIYNVTGCGMFKNKLPEANFQ